MFTKPHSRMAPFSPNVLSVVAASMAVIVLCRRRRRRCRQQRQNYRNVWMRPHIAARKKQGAYKHLVEELRKNEVGSYRNFMRMPPHIFDTLLALVTPIIQRETTNYREAISLFIAHSMCTAPWRMPRCACDWHKSEHYLGLKMEFEKHKYAWES